MQIIKDFVFQCVQVGIEVLALPSPTEPYSALLTLGRRS